MKKRKAIVLFLWFNPDNGAEILRRESVFKFSALVGLGIELMASFKTFPVFPDRVEISFKAE